MIVVIVETCTFVICSVMWVRRSVEPTRFEGVCSECHFLNNELKIRECSVTVSELVYLRMDVGGEGNSNDVNLGSDSLACFGITRASLVNTYSA